MTTYFENAPQKERPLLFSSKILHSLAVYPCTHSSLCKKYQNTKCCQLGHKARRRPATAAATGTTPNPIPMPATLLLKRRPQGCSDGAASPLMLGVQTILGCRPLAHSTSRKGCPGWIFHTKRMVVVAFSPGQEDETSIRSEALSSAHCRVMKNLGCHPVVF